MDLVRKDRHLDRAYRVYISTFRWAYTVYYNVYYIHTTRLAIYYICTAYLTAVYYICTTCSAIHYIHTTYLAAIYYIHTTCLAIYYIYTAHLAVYYICTARLVVYYIHATHSAVYYNICYIHATIIISLCLTSPIYP